MTAQLTYKDRAAGALYGMFIGDALAMPVHWYYNTKALEADYGWVTDFMEPFNPRPGAAGGVSCWPERWIKGLRHPPKSGLLNMPDQSNEQHLLKRKIKWN